MLEWGMKFWPLLSCFLPLLSLAAENSAPKFDARAAERFARLALACVQKEYPNKISHVLNSDADVARAAAIDPGFLRLLRLAFLGPRALAAGAAGAHFSGRFLCARKRAPR